jgi:hypothetical protein
MKSIKDYSVQQINPITMRELQLQARTIWHLFSEGDISADEMKRTAKMEHINIVEYILMLLDEIKEKFKTDDLNDLYETGPTEAKHFLEVLRSLEKYETIVRHISVVSNNISEAPEYWEMRAEKNFNDEKILNALIHDIRNGSARQAIGPNEKPKVIPFSNNPRDENRRNINQNWPGETIVEISEHPEKGEALETHEALNHRFMIYCADRYPQTYSAMEAGIREGCIKITDGKLNFLLSIGEVVSLFHHTACTEHKETARYILINGKEANLHSLSNPGNYKSEFLWNKLKKHLKL